MHYNQGVINMDFLYRTNDQVQILTTKNVSYLSHPPDKQATPDGIWTVTAVVGSDLLLVKQQAVIRIPHNDVKLIRAFRLEQIDQQLKEIING